MTDCEKRQPPSIWFEKGPAGERNRLMRAPEIRLNPKARAVLGIVQVPTDFNMDAEAGELIRHFPGVEIRMQKLAPSSMFCTAGSFNDNGGRRITDAAAVFKPSNYLSIIGLACTSMSFVLGADVVNSAFEAAQPGTTPTDTARAQVAAIRAVVGDIHGKRKVALLTPYIDCVHAANVDMLASAGFDVVGSTSMGIVASEFTSQISQTTILEYAVELAAVATDAHVIVIGCTALRATTHGFIDKIEQAVGRPVIASTHAFFWHMLRQTGVLDQIQGYGRLFRVC